MQSFAFDVDRFRAAVDDAKTVLSEHVQEVANTTVELAMDRTPYRRGTNRRSISADYTQGDGKKYKHVGETPSAGAKEGFSLTESQMGIRIYTQSGYGGLLEIGTKKMSARPYIIPSFTQAVEDLKRDLEGCV